MKKITLPVLGIFGLTTISLFAFNNPISENNEKKCHIKIVKIVNGVETVIDSTFDCDESMMWTSEQVGDIDIQIDGDDKSHVKIIKKFIDENGNETMVEGGDNKWVTEDENVMIDIDDNGTKKEVKIIKKVDDEGKVTVQKWVNGEEVEPSEEDLKKENKVMIFKSKDGGDVEIITEEGDHKMMMDVDVEVMEDGIKKHVVIISNITTKEIEDELPEVATNISKNELVVDDLTFSPNPNNGKFDLKFKTNNKKKPVSVKIFDLQGKEVYNETISKFSGNYSKNIDISENGKGTYILQILQDDKAKTSKVVIK